MAGLDLWKEEIDEPIRKAHQNVEDWHKRFGAPIDGQLFGHVKVGSSEETAETRFVGEAARAAAPSTRLPRGLDVSTMFAERDRLRELAAECGDIFPSAAEITTRAIANTKEAIP